MTDRIFGNIKDINEGTEFTGRKELRLAKIHLPLMHGIDGHRDVGASSIVLSGGYVDDIDLGYEIIYTGQGGNDLNTRRQISNQSWDTNGNKALIVSEMHGLPVRVTRGSGHKSEFSPKSGYRYAGLYLVTDHFQEIGKNGFLICRYRLEKVITSEVNDTLTSKVLPKGNEESSRTSTTVLRIVRDTKLSKEIKKLYDYKCQVCGISISVRGVRYAEAAHIKPLGKPHNGKDQPGNLICLCPNHHVMLDKGVFSVGDKLKLIGLDGVLNLHKEHTLDIVNLKYHEEHIYINDEISDTKNHL